MSHIVCYLELFFLALFYLALEAVVFVVVVSSEMVVYVRSGGLVAHGMVESLEEAAAGKPVERVFWGGPSRDPSCWPSGAPRPLTTTIIGYSRTSLRQPVGPIVSRSHEEKNEYAERGVIAVCSKNVVGVAHGDGGQSDHNVCGAVGNRVSPVSGFHRATISCTRDLVARALATKAPRVRASDSRNSYCPLFFVFCTDFESAV